MTPARGVVVAHGDLATALIRAAESISGVDGALEAVTNVRCSPETLVARVEAAAGQDPAVVFVDLASGSCALAGRVVSEHSNRVAVVTGVNLPILLDFLFHRELPLADLAERLVAAGRGGIDSHHGSETQHGTDTPRAGERRLADRPAAD